MIYAESSAILAWLLGDPRGAGVRQTLAAADLVLASDLTLIECDRILLRAMVVGELTEVAAADRRAHLTSAAAQWQLLRISSEVVERARRPFPVEPLRTLDAIHLASAIVARSAIAGLAILSLDDRLRKAASGLGFRLYPE